MGQGTTLTEEYKDYTYCNDCEVDFGDSFSLVEHVLEEDEEFNPYLVLPNGIKLLLGSLLRHIYDNADKPERVSHIAQSVYVTLFAAENGFQYLDGLVEDMVVDLELQDFDDALKEFLEGEANDNKGGA